MKITRDHYNLLKLAIRDVIGLYPSAISIMKDKKYSDMRIRWELYHHADIAIKNELYRYLNDDNIDTALKSIVGGIS
jgi:hypothetical protein